MNAHQIIENKIEGKSSQKHLAQNENHQGQMVGTALEPQNGKKLRAACPVHQHRPQKRGHHQQGEGGCNQIGIGQLQIAQIGMQI